MRPLVESLLFLHIRIDVVTCCCQAVASGFMRTPGPSNCSSSSGKGTSRSLKWFSGFRSPKLGVSSLTPDKRCAHELHECHPVKTVQDHAGLAFMQTLHVLHLKVMIWIPLLPYCCSAATLSFIKTLQVCSFQGSFPALGAMHIKTPVRRRSVDGAWRLAR